MAKSLRSKSKRSFRSKKRESGKYAAAEAARLNRLNAKLAAVKDRPASLVAGSLGVAAEMVTEEDPQGVVLNVGKGGEDMSVDEADRTGEKSKPVSTHGPRGSRREEWRASKGMDPVPKRNRMNRQGGLAARRKAGRPARRR